MKITKHFLSANYLPFFGVSVCMTKGMLRGYMSPPGNWANEVAAAYPVTMEEVEEEVGGRAWEPLADG